MTRPTTMHGYAVIPPISPWDEKRRDQIELHHAYVHIGLTPAEAWRRQCQANHQPLEAAEIARRTQHFHDRGYRLVRVTLTLHKDATP